MTSLNDFAESTGATAPTTGDWKARTEFDGESGYIVSRPRADEPATEELLRDWGYDPDKVEIVGPFKFSRWETAGGEWRTSYRATIQARNSTHIAYQDLINDITSWSTNLQTYTPETNHVAVLNCADWQIGKAMQIGGGTPGTLERIGRGFREFSAYVASTKPRAVVIVDNGDIIENIWSTPAQTFTNDLDVPAQIRTARRAMLEGLKMLAPLVTDITYVAVTSNHGAFRVGYKIQAGTSESDFGLEISHQLEDICKASPILSHIKFQRPEPLTEIAIVDTGDTRLAFTHGHLSKGAKMHGDWWAKMDHSRQPGWDADILVTAHYHSLRVEHSGNGRWIIGVSSADPGSDWFSKVTGENAQQGMTAFDVYDGQWSNLRIL